MQDPWTLLAHIRSRCKEPGPEQWLEGTCLWLLSYGTMLTVEHLKGSFLGCRDTQKPHLQGEAPLHHCSCHLDLLLPVSLRALGWV